MKFKNVIHILLLVLKLSTICTAQNKTTDFKAKQIKNIRVKEAYDTKWPQIQNELKASKINANTYDIYLRVFKHEKTVEVWLKNLEDSKYILFKTYAICSSSGDLGPKRKEGDGQVPEGFYTIDLFNPTSNYYLSMRISYPNKSDAILKSNKNAGGAIMIHGNCLIPNEYIFINHIET